jgi:lipopolysaccharide transport system permease protein
MSYIGDVIRARELLTNLAQREIRGKYKRTALGQLWSLANPIAAIIIYTFVFSFVFQIQSPVGDPSGLENYALFLVCGLLPWLFFSRVLGQGVEVIVANSGLIQKVYFPRIVLPISLTSAIFFSWMFEMAVLVAALLILQAFGVIPLLPLVLVFMVLLAIFASGLAMVASIVNVYFRDLFHLVTIALQFWFYLTPILYPVSLVEAQSAKLGGLAGTKIELVDLYRLNPMESYIAIFRNLLYDNRLPDLEVVLTAIGWAAVAAVAGFWMFAKREKQLAELL